MLNTIIMHVTKMSQVSAASLSSALKTLSENFKVRRPGPEGPPPLHTIDRLCVWRTLESSQKAQHVQLLGRGEHPERAGCQVSGVPRGAHHGLREVLHKLGQGGALQHLEHGVLHFLLVVHVVALVPAELVLCHHLQGGEEQKLVRVPARARGKKSPISEISLQPGPTNK